LNSSVIQKLYTYHFTLNRRLWERGITQLTDEEFVRSLGYSIGSIRNQIVHMMSVDRRWFARLEQQDVPSRLVYDDLPDRVSVRQAWDEIETSMQLYLNDIVDQDLIETVTYLTSRRGLMSDPRWRIMVHVVNHGTDHRAQTMAMLYMLGKPIDLEQDMMLLWWED
jgi:uncharacterized damage-inducible protein DinB